MTDNGATNGGNSTGDPFISTGGGGGGGSLAPDGSERGGGPGGSGGGAGGELHGYIIRWRWNSKSRLCRGTQATTIVHGNPVGNSEVDNGGGWCRWFHPNH